VLNSRDGLTAAGARAIAAAKNIAEGTGTSVDAAKVFRDAVDKGIALPELPPRSESPLAPEVSSTPLVNLSAHPVSAPIKLPATHPGARHVTSSTIPIPAGPHVAMPRQNKPAPAQRKTYAAPRKPPTAKKSNHKKYTIVAAAAVLLMIGVFMLPRCGKQPEPLKGKPVQKQP
jgi:hypothetical protein